MPLWPLDEPPPWIRAMTDVYVRAASVLDPDQYARAVLLREAWQDRCGPLDWASPQQLARLKFVRWLYQHERTGEYVL